MDAEALERELNELIGTTLADRYRLDALIGMGGMGGVFRAHHLGLRRDVAVKILHRALTNDSQVAPRFDREARSASRLDHPNCLRVTDYGSTADGVKFMVMQLFDGFELADTLGEPLAPDRAVALMLQIVRGLEHAHAHGVVHRDLKPENVFVTRDHDGDETLKIFDFGIAKIVEGDDGAEKMTRVGLVFGTPQYMSPEQATGVEEIDARTDLYSAGIILYEMLTGAPPFDASDPVAIIRMQVSTDPPALPKSVPRDVRKIVDKMLAKRRDDRYPSATAVREALERIGATVAVESTTSGRLLPDVGEKIAHGLSGVSAVGKELAQSLPNMEVVTDKLSRDRRWFLAAIGVAGSVVLGLTCALWPDDDGNPTAESAPPSAAAPIDQAVGAGSGAVGETSLGASAAELAQIDAHLRANDGRSARALLSPLLQQFPNDAQLLWREGQLLGSENKFGEALGRYAAALEHDEGQLGNGQFWDELMALMQRTELGPQALEIAVTKLGPRGHDFLLGMVNRERKVLTYEFRHRAIDHLDATPGSAAKVDRKLNTSLDLRQAQQSPTPCQTYREALYRARDERDGYYVTAIKKSKAPKPTDDAPVAEKAACKGLEEERAAVLAELAGVGTPAGGSGSRGGGRRTASRGAGTQPAETAPAQQPAPARQPTKTQPKSSKEDCDKPFMIFSKKCRK